GEQFHEARCGWPGGDLVGFGCLVEPARAHYERKSLAVRVRAAATKVREPSTDAMPGQVANDRATSRRLLVTHNCAAFADDRAEQGHLRDDFASIGVAQHLLVADDVALFVLDGFLAQGTAFAHRAVIGHRGATAQCESCCEDE